MTGRNLQGFRVLPGLGGRVGPAVAGLIVVIAWGAPAPAGEELGDPPTPILDFLQEPLPSDPPATRWPMMPGPRPSAERGADFFRDHLLPRLNRQLKPLRSREGAPDLHERVRAGVERAAQQALESFLLDGTVLDRLRWKLDGGSDLRSAARDVAGKAEEGRPPGGPRPTRAPPKSRMTLDARISHGAPEMLLRYERGQSSLRMSLDAEGTLGLELQAVGGMRITGRADPSREKYSLSWRVRF